jgi:hypothetical protein
MTDLDRRQLLRGAGAGLGLAALPGSDDHVQGAPHHRPRATRVVWLFQSGGPSQIELFDDKPALRDRHGEELPESIRQGQRLTAMSGNQSSLPLAGGRFTFARHGASGASISELLPHTAKVADELCIVRSLVTEAINHDPAITFVQTGSQIAGRPSIPAWLSYGLGPLSRDLPPACVMVTKDKGGQPLYQRLWGAGFLPARHQGVQLRPGKDPVLYLTDPAGVTRARRRRALDALGELHGLDGGADAAAWQEQAELAYRMQASVPEVADLSDEPEETFELYGEDARKPGSYAANCLLARRLLERGVRFVQLFHQGWDQHGGLMGGLRTQCKETDQGSAALVRDLRRRGLLEDTLVVWGGEFGRTSYCQGKLGAGDYGRDHHPRCASMWMAGGGVNAGTTYGETDEFSYNVARDPVHVHDLQATVLHLLGVDHERLTFKYQGRHFRLTDVHGEVRSELIV